jgi:ABC-type Fe3+-siderophore transport system permease subunit
MRRPEGALHYGLVRHDNPCGLLNCHGALFGALITRLCDLIARMWLSPAELPLPAITSFFGAPIVIGLLLKRGMKS